MAVGAALAVTSAMVVAPSAEAAVPPTKACAVRLSTTTPAQYSTVYVYVTKVPAAVPVVSVAKYKTTSTKKTAVSNSKGAATLSYAISRATPGYKVVVNVTAQKGTQKYACSTAFTPHKR
jgi:hypothetical protein